MMNDENMALRACRIGKVKLKGGPAVVVPVFGAESEAAVALREQALGMVADFPDMDGFAIVSWRKHQFSASLGTDGSVNLAFVPSMVRDALITHLGDVDRYYV